MSNNLLISIITVSYNSEKTIEQTINSVLNQNYSNIEYIIIDGKSTDKTLEIIKKYEQEFLLKKIKYKWISEKDNGIYDAMNKGIKISNGELIGIINSDDWYEFNTLKKIAEEYTKENFDMIYGNLRILNKYKSFIKKSKLKRIVSTRYWNHPTTFITKKVYEKQLYKLESINDDLDLLLKIRKNKDYKIVVLNEVLANFRMGGVSNKKELRQVFKNIKNRNRIYKNNGYSKLYYLDNFIMEIAKYILG